MQMRWKLLLTTSLLIPAVSQAFFCPTNFNQIDFGETIDQVTTSCGKPDKDEKKTEQPNVPQEWVYFVPQTVATSNPAQMMQGTLKTSITFDKDGRAINFSVNGLGVGESTICGPSLALGATQEDVKKACGAPAFINKQQAPDPASVDASQVKKIEIFTYSPSTGDVVLTFENGVLTKKE